MLYESVLTATIISVTLRYYLDIFKQLTWPLALNLKISQRYKTHNMKIKIKSQSFFKYMNKNEKYVLHTLKKFFFLQKGCKNATVK